MQNHLMDLVEKTSMKETVPKFEIGDTVDVHVRILEGDPMHAGQIDPVVVLEVAAQPSAGRLGIGAHADPATGQIGPPEVGLVAGLIRQRPVLDARFPVRAPGDEVDPPGVVVQRHHPARPALRRQE